MDKNKRPETFGFVIRCSRKYDIKNNFIIILYKKEKKFKRFLMHSCGSVWFKLTKK